MRDLFLKIESKETLELLLDHKIEGNYFQNDQYIIDFIGKIPKVKEKDTFTDEFGNVMEYDKVVEWTTQDRFNVRLLDELCTAFDNMESVTPEIPYRVFA